MHWIVVVLSQTFDMICADVAFFLACLRCLHTYYVDVLKLSAALT